MNMQVRRARTAFLIPFWSEESFASKLAELQWVNRRGKSKPVWGKVQGLRCTGRDREYSLPDEVRELDSSFQILLGAEEGAVEDRERRAWQWIHCRADPGLIGDTYLGNVQVRVGQGESFVHGKIERVETVLFPLGSGILTVHVTWSDVDYPGVRDAISRGRYLYRDDDRAGWRFVTEADGSRADPNHLKCLGAEMERACYGGAEVSLRQVAEWFLGGASAGMRLTSSRYAQHHSMVLLDGEPSEEERAAALFHLRRAYPGHYSVPDGTPQGDVILAPRGDRRIAVSREGVVSLIWGGAEGLSEYERTIWPHKFFGIYLLLGIHALGERQSLVLLASEIASFSNSLSDMRVLKKEHHSGRLGRLLRRVVRHTTTLTADDCGGPTDWGTFFRAVREVHAVDVHLAEVRAEATELFQLAEATGQTRVQTILAALGAATIPVAIVVALVQLPAFGLTDEPGWTAALIGLAIIVGIWLYYRLSPRTWN